MKEPCPSCDPDGPDINCIYCAGTGIRQVNPDDGVSAAPPRPVNIPENF
jgi:hypothetical protein